MNTNMQMSIEDKLSQFERMRENQRRANKKYRETHPEKFRNYSKKYYESNREKQKESMRQHYLKTKKAINEIQEIQPNIKE